MARTVLPYNNEYCAYCRFMTNDVPKDGPRNTRTDFAGYCTKRRAKLKVTGAAVRRCKDYEE